MTTLAAAAGILDSFAGPPVTLFRAALPTQNADGGFDEDDDPDELELDPCVVLPVSDGRELLMLPEGDRHRETIQIYARQALFLRDYAHGGDRVIHGGRSFRLVRVEDLEDHGDVFLAHAVLEDTVPS